MKLISNFKLLQIEYYLKWKGYDDTQNTWEPKENLECDELIREFEEKRKREEEVSPLMLDVLSRHLPEFKFSHVNALKIVIKFVLEVVFIK